MFGKVTQSGIIWNGVSGNVYKNGKMAKFYILNPIKMLNMWCKCECLQNHPIKTAGKLIEKQTEFALNFFIYFVV